MVGLLKFYDDDAGWGVILGEDGRLYAVRQVQLIPPRSEAGDRVSFEPRKAPGGLRAIEVRRATVTKTEVPRPPAGDPGARSPFRQRPAVSPG